MNPNVQRIALAAVAMVLAAQFAAQMAQSPTQLLVVLGMVGLVLGGLFRTGHRHLITGYAIGLVLTMIFEFITIGPIIQMTGPVYVAGYLFATAAGLTARFVRAQLPAYWTARRSHKTT